MASLRGKVALVTGAERGIGRAIAHRLAAEGAEVIVNYPGAAGPAEQVVAEIRKAGGNARTAQADVSNEAAKITGVKPHIIACDLTDGASRQAMIAAAKKQLGQVDILIHNTGGPKPTAVEATQVGIIFSRKTYKGLLMKLGLKSNGSLSTIYFEIQSNRV